MSNSLLNIGFYTLSEASRLTNIPTQKIRNWLYGNNPLWQPEIDNVKEKRNLTFKDLMEIRLVDRFREYGVSLQTIRKATEIACSTYDTKYPFSTQKFKTDGKGIFAEISKDTEDTKLIDLLKKQWAFNPIIAPSFKDVVFDGNEIEKWYPIGRKKPIILDPKRSFGRPIIEKSGIPTYALFSTYKAEGDIGVVSRLYELPRREVQAAVDFEERLAA